MSQPYTAEACACSGCSADRRERCYLLSVYLDQWVRLRPATSPTVRLLFLGSGAAGAEVDVLAPIVRTSTRREAAPRWSVTFLDPLYAPEDSLTASERKRATSTVAGLRQCPAETLDVPGELTRWQKDVQDAARSRLRGAVPREKSAESLVDVRFASKLPANAWFDGLVAIGWDVRFAPRPAEDPLLAALTSCVVEDNGLLAAHVAHDRDPELVPFPWVLGTGRRPELVRAYKRLRAERLALRGSGA